MSTPIEETTLKVKDPELTAVLYRIIGLSKKWIEDKEALFAEKKEFSHLIHTLNERLDEISALEENVTDVLVGKVKNIASSFNNQIKDTVKEEMRLHMQSVTESLSFVSKDFKQTIKNEDRYIFGDLKIFGLTILCCMIIGVMSGVITHFFMPKPHVNISDQALSYFKKGEALNEVWPKLSKSEQARLKKLLNHT